MGEGGGEGAAKKDEGVVGDICKANRPRQEQMSVQNDVVFPTQNEQLDSDARLGVPCIENTEDKGELQREEEREEEMGGRRGVGVSSSPALAPAYPDDWREGALQAHRLSYLSCPTVWHPTATSSSNRLSPRLAALSTCGPAGDGQVSASWDSEIDYLPTTRRTHISLSLARANSKLARIAPPPFAHEAPRHLEPPRTSASPPA
ncbi:hypothetical protein BCR34DRAFT_41330 [Clohesyomyces aquaticus]|uniref:Uncharacterized protein n=1 Tax=Clohesyomyces aquaticus TaxID=1231657 RepID=A0A1Y1Z6V4_9PLEO|nr:hypothetical protein BCR34DRAFT_41330 [Clohesyomyces aquaticus]